MPCENPICYAPVIPDPDKTSLHTVHALVSAREILQCMLHFTNRIVLHSSLAFYYISPNLFQRNISLELRERVKSIYIEYPL